MKCQARFCINGQWTRWFDCDKLPPELKDEDIEAVQIQEQMSREEFERRKGEIGGNNN